MPANNPGKENFKKCIAAKGLLSDIYDKVIAGERITLEEGLALYEKASLSFLGILSDYKKRQYTDDKVFYNRNFHIEPTNCCIYNCRFCSYNSKNSGVSWDYTHDEMVSKIKNLGSNITEIHIVGAVHPSRGKEYYGALLQLIRAIHPSIHLKAFTAIELSHMAKVGNESVSSVLRYLQECGLNSIPGGGAEIFDEKVRQEICPEKDDAATWLKIHKTAHHLGIPSNATMLYGHIETYQHRLSHMSLLRDLQESTGGFNAFIPLKFKNKHNRMQHIPETTLLEDLRNFAVSRIFLDNIPHIKAYWPMMGIAPAQLSLCYGVDDIDGTIYDSTKIYTLAGSSEQQPEMTATQLTLLIEEAGYVPVERDSLYKPITG